MSIWNSTWQQANPLAIAEAYAFRTAVMAEQLARQEDGETAWWACGCGCGSDADWEDLLDRFETGEVGAA